MADDGFPAQYAWVLEIPEEELMAELPVELREIGEVIGVPALMRLLERYQGQQIYLGKFDGPAFRRLRRKRILAEFTGQNQTELARKYGTSVRHVYRILDEIVDARQQSMF